MSAQSWNYIYVVNSGGSSVQLKIWPYDGGNPTLVQANPGTYGAGTTTFAAGMSSSQVTLPHTTVCSNIATGVWQAKTYSSWNTSNHFHWNGTGFTNQPAMEVAVTNITTGSNCFTSTVNVKNATSTNRTYVVYQDGTAVATNTVGAGGLFTLNMADNELHEVTIKDAAGNTVYALGKDSPAWTNHTSDYEPGLPKPVDVTDNGNPNGTPSGWGYVISNTNALSDAVFRRGVELLHADNQLTHGLLASNSAPSQDDAWKGDLEKVRKATDLFTNELASGKSILTNVGNATGNMAQALAQVAGGTNAIRGVTTNVGGTVSVWSSSPPPSEVGLSIPFVVTNGVQSTLNLDPEVMFPGIMGYVRTMIALIASRCSINVRSLSASRLVRSFSSAS